ncbi:MAG: hypothetical protein AAGE52_25140 [Myxococcota bacterium]
MGKRALQATRALRWLALVALAAPATAIAQARVVDLTRGAIAPTAGFAANDCHPISRLAPAHVSLRDRAVLVRTASGQRRHSWAVGDEFMWIATTRSVVVIGIGTSASHETRYAFAIDVASGERRWRRELRTRAAANLRGAILVETEDALVILDAATGVERSRTSSTSNLVRVCREQNHYLIKTTSHLHVVDAASLSFRWSRPSSSGTGPRVVGPWVVDAWVDRQRDRFGVVVYDQQGRVSRTIDVGKTGGWYDIERVVLAPIDNNRIGVNATFGVEF